VSNRRGFLLLEVMVAVVIVAAALIYVTRVYSTANKIVKRSQTMFEYGLLLEGKMFEFEEGGAIKGIKDTKEETGALEDHEGYFWNMSAVKLSAENPDIKLDINRTTLDMYQQKKAQQADKYSIVTYLKNG
jgi:Tfp pilus assembly protein PilE